MNYNTLSKEELLKELCTLKSEREILVKENDHLQDFVENGTLGLHWVNDEGIIIWANQADYRPLGYSREEYIGQVISKFHADEEVINDILTRLTNNETLTNYKARLKHKNGSIKHVLINSSVKWHEGQFDHTRCFTRDVTAMVENGTSLQQMKL